MSAETKKRKHEDAEDDEDVGLRVPKGMRTECFLKKCKGMREYQAKRSHYGVSHEACEMGCPLLHFRHGYIYRLRELGDTTFASRDNRTYIGLTRRKFMRALEHKWQPTLASALITATGKPYKFEILQELHRTCTREEFDQALLAAEAVWIDKCKSCCLNRRMRANAQDAKDKVTVAFWERVAQDLTLIDREMPKKPGPKSKYATDDERKVAKATRERERYARLKTNEPL